jgi:hypothetical protein
MKNIYLLPTNKPTRLHIDLIDNSLLLFSDSLNLPHKPTGKHICITSDEAIKDGDWCLFESSGVIRKVVDSTFSIGVNNIRMYAEKKVFKIILTTDPDLIKDSIQAIDDTFLEWFVNNPSCEEVDVCKVEQIPDGITFGMFGNDEPPTELIYKIIIPQEEPKQETFREFIFKVPFDYNIKPKEVIDMCMKEQENIILTYRLEKFIEMINSLPDDTEKNRILKSVFNNREGELLLESYKSMKSHYEK